MMCYLIPILTGLISAFLGYLLGKLLGGGQNFKVEYDAELEKNRRLSADLSACNNKFAQSEKDILGFKSNANAASDWEAKYKTLSLDANSWKTKVADLESQLKLSKEAIVVKDNSADLEALKVENNSLKMKISQLESRKVETYFFDAESAKTVYEKSVQQDDLKIVEGIGPKIEELFHNAGIKTWKQLAETSVEKCQEVLNSGGEHYQIHNPATWPKQSELAYKNQWAELKKWQDELDGGK